MQNYDVVVVGLGAMGSATLFQLAKRGLSVLGIDQFSPPHDQGSSHGDTRITRLAIGEGSHYTPLVMRSQQIWQEVAGELGRDDLFNKVGLLAISSGAAFAEVHVKDFFETTVNAAKKFGIKHDLLSADQLRKQFPQLNIQDDESGYYEYDAGFLRPEKCIAANLKLASKYGAELVLGTKVVNVKGEGSVEIVTEKQVYRADSAVITAGAWVNDFVRNRKDIFKIYRQVLYWFDVSECYDSFKPENMPVFIWEPQGVPWGIYGFPAVDGPEGGLKVSAEIMEHSIEGPDSLDRNVTESETLHMFETYVKPLFKGIGSKCVRSAVCMYTTTPDAGFVIDKVKGSQNRWYASPCSGHGFKHSAGIGEALAQLLIDGETQIDLSGLSMNRFGAEYQASNQV